jgi:hypothetical protein
MKKLFLMSMFALSLLVVNAQKIITSENFTKEQAKSLAVNVMASFTESVSFAYKPGLSFDQFTANLYSSGVETPPIVAEGNQMLQLAYKYLSRGYTKSSILKLDDGKAVASTLIYLNSQRSDETIKTTGSEIFGGRSFAENSTIAGKASAACHWYQFWCHVQNFVTFVVDHWSTISVMICQLANICP